jgi:deoxyribonuclease V
MIVNVLHSWELSPAGAREVQRRLAERLRLRVPDGMRIVSVCGADVSFARTENRVYAAAVVLSFPKLTVEEVATAVCPAAFPYVPGLLSFREGPALLEALERLTASPDVILFDGQGLAHPRGLGIAGHLGLFLQRPTIGVAKKPLVGEYLPPGPEPGDTSPLVHKHHQVGTVLRTRRGVKPVFVSPGHLMDFDTATRITFACCRGYRLPEPTRRAHILSNRLRRGEPFARHPNRPD